MAAVDSINTVPSAQLILGFGFLHARLLEVLDSQRRGVSGEVVEPDQSGLDAAVGPLVPNPFVVKARWSAMDRLRQWLAPIAASGAPQADAAFRQRLVELREALEDVYGQRLTFGGEQREPTGTKVEVSQEIDTVWGLAVGADIASDWAGGDITATQKLGVVEKQATAIGARLGGDLRKDQP